MLNFVKMALRISENTFDAEITVLINAALKDLQMSGIITDNAGSNPDPIIEMAVATYVKAHFGQPDNYDKLKASYDEQKAQLKIATGYTDWGE